jgi:hypothetical protein
MSRTRHHGSWGKKAWVKRPVGANWWNVDPAWWTRLRMNRPARAATRRLLNLVITGRVDTDNVVFAPGGRKPHPYFH